MGSSRLVGEDSHDEGMDDMGMDEGGMGSMKRR